MPLSRRVFLLFTCAYFFSEFYRAANSVLARDLAIDLTLNATQLGLLTSVLFAAFALAQFPLGIAFDRWQPQRVVASLMFVGAAGSLLVAFANSFWLLALGRLLIGVGISGTLMGSLKAFSQWFPANRYATMAGALLALGSSGSLMAATPLAWLNQQVGWRLVFAGSGVLMGLSALALLNGIGNAPLAQLKQSPAGTGSMRQVLGDLHFWRICAALFVFNGAQYAFQGLWAGPFLLDVPRLSTLAAGNLVLLLSLGMTVGYWLSGWLGDRIGAGWVIMAGLILSTLCFGLLCLPLSVVSTAILYALLGLASATLLLTFAQIRLLYPIELIGRASSTANFFVFAGIFAAQWLFGLILDRHPVDTVGRYPLEAYATAFGVVVVASLAVIGFYAPLARRTSE
jgi:predicted MFS family arabinose efflux permease